MNAVERLQAAIEKLEALKAASTPGPWTTTWGSATLPAVDDLGSDDAELIVTLHRTIDAQLAILRFGVQRLRAVAVLTGKHAEAHVHELALADAILGSTS